MIGPFFEKDPSGAYFLTNLCEECAFRSDDSCIVAPCPYLPVTDDEEEYVGEIS